MAGTSKGAKKAAALNKKLHGADFYARIGAMGGKKSRGGGFEDRDLARRAGAIGGSRSRRGKKVS
jgi:general stress protein YciG